MSSRTSATSQPPGSACSAWPSCWPRSTPGSPCCWPEWYSANGCAGYSELALGSPRSASCSSQHEPHQPFNRPGARLITERDVEPGNAIAYLARWQHAALDDCGHGLPHRRGTVPDRGRPPGTDPGPDGGRAASPGDGGPRGSGPARRVVL